VLAYLYVQLFNVFVYGSCICMCHIDILGNWFIRRDCWWNSARGGKRQKY